MLRRTALLAVLITTAGLGVATLATTAQAAPTWLGIDTLSAVGHPAEQAHLAVNAAGDAVAVWLLRDDASNLRVQAARRPAGGTWSLPTTLSAGGFSAYGPSVAIDGRGAAVVIWRRSDGTTQRIQASISTADGTWGAPVWISAADHHADNPQVAADPHGAFVAIWTVEDGLTARVQTRRRPAGGPWDAPVYLSRAGFTAGVPQIAVNSAGTAAATWLRFATTWRTETARRPPGGPWTSARAVSDVEVGAAAPQIAINDKGDVVIVWVSSDGVDHLITSARRPVNGSWSAPLALSVAGQPASKPDVALDDAGTAFAVWQRSDGTNDRIQEAHQPASGSWTAPSELSAPAHDALTPQIALDSLGNAVAVWAANDGQVDRAQASRRPKDGVWGSAATLSEPSHTAFEPSIAVDPRGDAVVVWSWEISMTDVVVKAVGLDAAGPVAKVTKPAAAAQHTKDFTVAWSAADVWSTVANEDVRYRDAPNNASFGSWTAWKTQTTVSSAVFTGLPGHTYCFEMRARDVLDNVGAWSPQRCTAVPLDDRALGYTSGWTRTTGSSYYLQTETQGNAAGATLSRANVQAKRIALLVTRCPGCGKVSVSLAGTPLGTFSLGAAALTDAVLIPVTAFGSVRSGTLRIRITSSTKPVRIDGVVLSRA